MAQEKPNRLAEWVLLLREQTPVVRRRFLEWVEAIREEPVLLWHTAAVRFTVYLIAGLVLLWCVTGLRDLLLPPPPTSGGVITRATTADFHVLCADSECGHHFVTQKPFGFRKFPVECPRCKQQTGAHARRCASATCRGRWVAPQQQDGLQTCPKCDAALPRGAVLP